MLKSKVKCPKCENGQINITVHEKGEVHKVQLSCPDCESTGKITEDEYQKLKNEEEFWCACDNPSENVVFYDEYEHCWVCADCKKIVQVG